MARRLRGAYALDYTAVAAVMRDVLCIRKSTAPICSRMWRSWESAALKEMSNMASPKTTITLSAIDKTSGAFASAKRGPVRPGRAGKSLQGCSASSTALPAFLRLPVG